MSRTRNRGKFYGRLNNGTQRKFLTIQEARDWLASNGGGTVEKKIEQALTMIGCEHITVKQLTPIEWIKGSHD